MSSVDCISLTSWWVGMESSRRRDGLVERRSLWMQNHTWPRRGPKIVPITIVLDGRGGATDAASGDEMLQVSTSKLSSRLGRVSWLVLGWESPREVLMRLFEEVVAAVAMEVAEWQATEEDAELEKQGRRKRQRALLLVIRGWVLDLASEKSIDLWGVIEGFEGLGANGRNNGRRRDSNSSRNRGEENKICSLSCVLEVWKRKGMARAGRSNYSRCGGRSAYFFLGQRR